MILSFLAVLAMLVSSTPVMAADTWIHVVGVDERNPKQNYGSFYESAQAFEEKCAQSSRKPQCHLFINNDPKLRTNLAADTFKLPSNKGQTSSANLVGLIREKIAQATSGDTVIISLQNHGGPVSKRSPSCVWLSSSDYICESDLRTILREKPLGVKVFVNADACFSGSFAELSTSEICATSMSDRLNFGSIGRRDLWNSVSERHPRTLADLAEPIFNESGTQRLLGSQLILQQLCRQTREKLGKGASVSDLSFVAALPVFQDPKECRDTDLTAGRIIAFASQVLSATSRGSNTCQSLKLPEPVCDAKTRMSKSDVMLRQTIRKLEIIAANEVDLGSWVTNNFQKLATVGPELESKLKQLSPEEARELSDSFTLGDEPVWSKFKPEKREIAKDAWSGAKDFFDRVRSSKLLGRERDAVIEQLKKDGQYDDLMILQNCLFENKPQTIENQRDSKTALDLSVYRQQIASFPERKFSIQDYKDARKCESSIQF